MDAQDETRITEITILPDGRICVFGTSREVLEILGELDLGDPAFDQRLSYLRRVETESRHVATCHSEPALPEAHSA